MVDEEQIYEKKRNSSGINIANPAFLLMLGGSERHNEQCRIKQRKTVECSYQIKVGPPRKRNNKRIYRDSKKKLCDGCKCGNRSGDNKQKHCPFCIPLI